MMPVFGLIELAVPVLGATTSFLGSAVLGYRIQRRARQVRAAVKQRIEDRKATREVVGLVQSVKQKVVDNVDQDAALAAIGQLLAKHNLTKVVQDAAKAEK